MSLWMQLTAAVSAALAAGIMGKALVPFLEKFRFCEPLHTSEETEGAKLRPTMGGILLVFGTLCGLSLSGALCIGTGILDRTEISAQKAFYGVMVCFSYAFVSALAGFGLDVRCVQRRPALRKIPVLRALGVYLVSLVFSLLLHNGETIMDFTGFAWDAGALYAPICALLMSVLWLSAAALEEEPDGTGLTVAGILLLSLTVVLLRQDGWLYALLSLASAGSCMGAMVWCLFPARCRLGKTGQFWLCGCLAALSAAKGKFMPMLLMTAVYLLNLLPCILPARNRETRCSLQRKLSGEKDWKKIAVFSGFAAFCGVLAVLTEA